MNERFSLMYAHDNGKDFNFIEVADTEKSFKELKEAIDFIKSNLLNNTMHYFVQDNQSKTFWLNIPKWDDYNNWVELDDYYAISDHW